MSAATSVPFSYATPTDEPRLTEGALPPAFAGGDADAPAASLAKARDDAIMTFSVESVAAACAGKRFACLLVVKYTTHISRCPDDESLYDLI